MKFAMNGALTIGTWDGAKRTGGANGSILNELERPENGGLKYGAALLGLARKASQAELPKGARQLSDADFIQVVGAAAVEAGGDRRASQGGLDGVARQGSARVVERGGEFGWGSGARVVEDAAPVAAQIVRGIHGSRRASSTSITGTPSRMG